MSKTVRSPRGLLRPLLFTAFGIAGSGVAIWSMAGILAVGTSLASGSSELSKTQPRLYHTAAAEQTIGAPAASPSAKSVILQPQSTYQVASLSDVPLADIAEDIAPEPAQTKVQARFDAVARDAAVTPEKLAALLQDRLAKQAARKGGKLVAAPAPERFAAPVAAQPVMLAYADPSPSAAAGALAALSAVAPTEDDLLGQDEAVALPDFENTPDAAPLPLGRPRVKKAEKPAVEAQEELAIAIQPDKPKKPKEKEVKVAFAKPDNPAEEKSGGLFSNLFKPGRPKAGNGVAVYDISAARVYMPDGTVLEAHSGIGKMADNPNYVHVKMNGPTPPHTYNLRMREKRFHGVEAIRMLPVDGRNKHGRDGFLTHSYLLRGGRAESHGCVAFKDYNKFLNAFKQGKVKQLVVVPGNGKKAKKPKIQVAKNGDSA